MGLQGATAFDGVYMKQAKKAQELTEKYEKGVIKLGKTRHAAQGIATSVLRDDLTYQLRNGKEIKFTPRVKSLIENQRELLKEAGILEEVYKNCKCLLCGRVIANGEIALVEKYVQSNAACIPCLNSKNVLKMDDVLQLVEVRA